MKKALYYIACCTIIALLTYMIHIGSTGLALQPKKEVFTFKQGETLPLEPSYYLKGVTDPTRVHMTVDQIDSHKVGSYTAKVKQSSRRYQFTIQITK